MDNPYLDFYLKMRAKDDGLESVKARYPACLLWSFAVPNREAIERLVAMSPVVEIGAGTGYWGMLVRQAGGTIDLYDIAPPGDPAYFNKYQFKETYVPVAFGGTHVLQQGYENHTLFLCWPSYLDDVATRCLQTFRGTRLVYVGEDKGGCCAEDSFFKLLEDEWIETEQIDIPQWWAIHDGMWVYERKKKDAQVQVRPAGQDPADERRQADRAEGDVGLPAHGC